MILGLSNYAYFWQTSDRAPRPLSAVELLDRAVELGVEVVQLCDFAPLATMGPKELRRLRDAADGRGILLEVGTRGVAVEHLTRYLRIAADLGARLLRSMLHGQDYQPTPERAVEDLRAVLPLCERHGVTIALETYEQVPSTTLMEVVDTIDHPLLGVCIDPANSVAALELPADVIERTADRVANIHVKDFAFTRTEGWVGFTLAGCPLGTGLLDYDFMIERIGPKAEHISQVIEQWVPWQGDFESTARIENLWTERSVEVLRGHRRG